MDRVLSAAKSFQKCSKYVRSRPRTSASGVGPLKRKCQMPGWLVVDGLPPLHARQKRIHQHEPVHVLRKLRGVRVSDHQTDVVAYDGGLAQSQLLNEVVNPDRRMRHVEPIGRYRRSADA